MEMDWSESTHRGEKDELHDSPGRHRQNDDSFEKSSKYSSRDKDRKKSSRGEDRDRERDHKNKDRERSKKIGDDVQKDLEKDKDKYVDKDRSKDRSKDAKTKDKDHDREKSREKERERDRERKERGKEKDRERERETDKERVKEKTKDRDREREKERERIKEKERERENDKHKDREMDRENDRDKDRDREKARDKTRAREIDTDKGRSRERERERVTEKSHEEDHERSKDDQDPVAYDDDTDEETSKPGKLSFLKEADQNPEAAPDGTHMSTSELEDRILKMKQERTLKKSEGGSEILSWVSRNRKLEEKRNAERKKAMQLSKIFEEQDNIGQEGESDDEEARRHISHDLAGVKVLHGLDKVMEGGAVVLTLKDQSILADGDINEDVDMLENVEMGEQKRRDDAYKAAKRTTGIEDKFNDDPSLERKILPQYDDSTADEGVTLDERGGFTGEAEKKLEELRKRLLAPTTSNRFEDLTMTGKVSAEYYTQEEMLQFKKPKKKKSLRKKDKLDLDALEAEAVSAGLGIGDLGSRSDGRSKAVREEQERSEAEKRNSAYQSAYAKADEASKSLRWEQALPTNLEEDENPVFADDDEDLNKSLERARKLALKKQEEEASGPQAIARLAASTSTRTTDDQDSETAELQENKVVFTEVKEFVWGLQLGEESHKPDSEDVFKDEDEAPRASDEENKDEVGGWTEAKDGVEEENPIEEDGEEIVPDKTIHEVAVGKGLSGALKLFKDRGNLKETVEWGGRNMDKKKSKLVGIVDNDANNDANGGKFKDIRIERTDEFGRILTPKEAFRLISHKFHGKGPGKMKQEKRMKQYEQELKLKQMKNSDTPSLSVERMREAQAQLKTPYLVLSGQVKPGQTSDPRSGFATVEKEIPGGLTPMLGDKKVEHFLGIKRKAESGSNNSMAKKPKP